MPARPNRRPRRNPFAREPVIRKERSRKASLNITRKTAAGGWGYGPKNIGPHISELQNIETFDTRLTWDESASKNEMMEFRARFADFIVRSFALPRKDEWAARLNEITKGRGILRRLRDRR